MEEKILETFIGYIDKIDGDTAYITLKSRDHDDTLYGNYPVSELTTKLGKEIFEQSRFLCKTVKVNEYVRIDFEALPDIKISKEDIVALEKEIEEALGEDDE